MLRKIMNRASLLKAVEFASRVIQGRVSLPILECVHLKGGGSRLTVTGYNLDLYARMEVESDLEIDLCVRSRMLKTALAAEDGGEIALTESGDTIVVAGKGRKSISVLPGGDFPPIPEVTGERFTIPGEAIARVIHAVSDDESRYTLNGVHLDSVALSATDGRRLATVKIDGPKDAVIIPSQASALLSGATGEMRVNSGKFVATGDGWEIGGKLIEGQYPNLKQAIPSFKPGIPLSEDALDAITRAMVHDEKGTVEIGRDYVSSGLEPEEYREAVETGLCRLKINAKYFLDACKNAGPGFTVSATDDISPVVITNGPFLAVIMPLRLS